MIEFLPYILTAILVILATIMAAVGIQVLLVLNQVRKTLRRVNMVIDGVDEKYQQLIKPFSDVGSMAAGVKTGLKLAEMFGQWLNQDSSKK